ncbi:MAG TPA: DUF5666 domain-containing protein [Anaerolineae bacterium]|nr:DUF5666 domain-containing protein [Anaerolineae bacterium]
MKRSNYSRSWTAALAVALAAVLAMLGAACAPSASSPGAPLAPAPGQAQGPRAAEAGENAQVSSEMEPEIEFFGAIESIGADAWTIDGQAVRLTEQTRIKDAAELHDRVRVHARVMADGSLAAREIERAGDDMFGRQGAQFEFTGAVEAMDAAAWAVDGQSVAITAHTEIKGGIEAGDLVKVHALVGAGSSLIAREIELAREDQPAIPGVEVEFHGALETVGAGAWTIGGMTFHVTAATEIEGGVGVGDFVKAHARRQSDGSLWAREIEREEEQRREGGEVEFSGTVEAMGADGWTIDGMTVHVTAQTEIEDGIDVGDFVKVHTQVAADGSLVAREIKLDESGSGDAENDNDDNGNANDNGDDNQNGNNNDNGNDDNQNDNENGDNGNDNQNANENDNQNGNDNGNDNGGDGDNENGNDNGDD